MMGLSRDVVVAIQVVSLFGGLLGAVMIARCGSEAMQLFFRKAWSWARRANPTVRRAVRAHARGHLEHAHWALNQVLLKAPNDYAATLAMWEIARDAGFPEQAERAMLRAIRREIRNGDRESAARHWIELGTLRVRTVREEPGLLVRIGSCLHASNRRRAARRAFERALDASIAAQDAQIAARVARGAIDLDREMAEEAAWHALASETLELTERFGLQALLRRLYPPEAGTGLLECHEFVATSVAA